MISTRPVFYRVCFALLLLFGNENSFAQTLTSSNLPIVIINTHGQAVLNSPKIICDMGIINNGSGIRNFLTDPPNEYNGKIGIEFRGSHTQNYPKKSYGFETMDNSGTIKIDVGLFGFAPEHDWILNASYIDKSFCRDVLAYQLSNEMGHYASHCQYVELIVNGQYEGIYILMEKVKRDKGRINIAKLDPHEVTPPDITGGYVIKLDKLSGNPGRGWTSPYPPMETGIGQVVYFLYSYPSSDSIVPAQEAYIQSFIDSFETALAGPNFRDPLNGYQKFISEASWIDYFFINEISRNIDAYRISVYLHKDKNKKLKAGPVWDYNIAWGNASVCNAGNISGWSYDYPCVGDGFQVPFWWERLLEDTNYTNELKCRWQKFRGNILSNQHIFSVIDSISGLLNESQTRNFTRWPILGTTIWPNPSPAPSTYNGEIQYLKDWIEDRLSWLDNNLPGNCNCDVQATAVNVTCNSSCDGKIIVTASTPYEPTFTWNNGLEDDTLSSACAGNYQVVMIDDIGCSDTADVNLSQPSVLSVNASSTNSSCINNGCSGTATLNVTGGLPPYVYQWSGGQTTLSVNSLCSGTHIATVTDSRGCSKSVTVSIQNPSAPVIALLQKQDVSCYNGNDGSATLNVNGGVFPYNFSWSPNVSSNNAAVNLAPGTYTATVTDATGCPSQITFNIDQPLPISIQPDVTQPQCFGANGSVSLNVSGGITPYSYQWSNGSNNSSLMNVPAAFYSVTITDNNGCTATSGMLVSEPPVISVNHFTTPPSCFDGADGQITVNAGGGIPPFTYSWPSLNINSNSISNLTAGDYQVIVEDANNCTSSSIITLNNSLPLDITIQTSAATCNINDGSATAIVNNGVPPYSYSWFPASVNTQSAFNLHAGTQMVTVTDANGCSETDTATIVSASGLNIQVFGQTMVSCHGGNDAFVSIQVNGGFPPYDFHWPSTGNNSNFASELSAGSHHVTISDFIGCTTDYQLIISEPDPVNVQGNSTPATCFGYSDGALTAIASGGTAPFSYHWISSGTNSQTLNNLPAGSYSVMVTDNNNCTSTSTFSVIEPDQLSVSVNSTGTSCNKQNGIAASVVNGGNGQYSYLWSNGSADSIAINLAAGNYLVSVTDYKGCSATASANISSSSSPEINLSSLSSVSCNGGSNGSISISVTGAGPFVYNWIPNVSTGPTALNLSTGIYSVVVTDQSSCTDSSAFIIHEPPPLTTQIFSQNKTCHDMNDGMLFIDAEGGTPPYNYEWSNGNTSDTAFNLSQGNYSVIITDNNHCAASASGTISSPDSISIEVLANNASCQTCNDGWILAEVNGGVSPYSYSWQPVLLPQLSQSNLGAGIYTLCVNDSAGCTKCKSVEVKGGSPGIEEINDFSGLYVFPNPLYQSTVFAFKINKDQKIELRIYSADGRFITTAFKDQFTPGEHLFRFDASDLTPGFYFYHFILDNRFIAGSIIVNH